MNPDAVARKSIIETQLKVNTSDLDAFNKRLDSMESGADSVTKAITEAQKAVKGFTDSLRSSGDKVSVFADKISKTNKSASDSYSKLARDVNEQFKKIQASLDKTSSYNNKFADNSNKAFDKVEDKASNLSNQYEAEMARIREANRQTVASFQELNSLSGRVPRTGHTVTNGTSNGRSVSSNRRDLGAVGAGMIANGTNMSLGSLGLAATFLSGAKDATNLQNEQVKINNLAVTGGENPQEVKKQMKEIAKQRQELSQKYGIDQKDIAQGYETLVRRGYSTKQAKDAQKYVVQGSIASGDDYNDVVDNATSVIDAFGLKRGSEATKNAINKMAYASDLTATDFKDMGLAMQYTGPTAKAANQTLGNASAALGVLSNSGQTGSVAGTSMRDIYNRLTTPTAGGSKALESMGIKVDDAKGRLRPIQDIFTDMNKKMQGMTGDQKMNIFHRLFGTTGQDAAFILAKHVDSLKELNKQIDNAQNHKGGGYIQSLSDKNMKSYQSQINRFKSAWKAFSISMADSLMPVVTKILHGLTDVFDAINNMPKGMKTVAAGFAVFIAAIGPVTLVIGGLFKAIDSTSKSIGWLKSSLSSKSSNSFTSNLNKQADEAQIAAKKFQDANQMVQSGDDYYLDKKRSVGSNLVGANLGELKEKPRLHGDFKAASDIKAAGQFAKAPELSDISKRTRFLSRFHGVKATGTGFGKIGTVETLASDANRTGLLSKIGSVGKLGSLSKLGRFAAGGVGGLDVINAGMSLQGMNKKNAGSKIGDAAGSLGGAALGTVIAGPIGTAIGGMAGSFIGKTLGSELQKHLPKGAFNGIVKQWNNVKKWFSKSVKDISKPFVSAWKTVSKSFAPVSKAFSDFNKKLHSTKSGQQVLAGVALGIKASMIPLKLLFWSIGKTFQVAMSLIKATAKGIATTLKDIFVGTFKTITGIFKLGTDLLTGKWSNLGKDLTQIGHGILQGLTAPFDGALSAIKSVGSDIVNYVEDLWKSIGHTLGKVGDFIKHPIQSIKSMFASGTKGKYPNGLPKDTRAIVNDGNGPELIRFGDGYGMFKGRNVETVLPKGSHVYSAEDTKKLINVQHFAKGTRTIDQRIKGANGHITVSLNMKSVRAAVAATTRGMKRVESLVMRGYRNSNRVVQKQMEMLNKFSKKSWDSIADDTKKLTSDSSKDTIKTYESLRKQLSKTMDTIHDGMNDATKSMVKDFGDIMGKLAGLAGKAMQATIGQLNHGFSGINSALGQFGNSDVLKPIKYATGSNGRLNHDQIAMINDATAGPRQEAVVRDNKVYLPKGDNKVMKLNRGDQVLNGHQTEKLLNGIQHYAKGSGVSDDELTKIAQSNAKNPNQAFQSEFLNHVKVLGSNLQEGLTSVAKGAAKNIGQPWSKAMWSLINNTIGSGGGSGSKGEFLRYAEKIGTGKPYVFGGFDCSKLIQDSLAHFDINIGRDTVAQSHSDGVKYLGKNINNAEVGDLVYFGTSGANAHVGIVSDKQRGLMMNQTPPSGRISSIQSAINIDGLDGYYSVKGLHSADGNNSKGGNMLDKLVKSELGSNAIKWITKHLGATGGMSNPVGDGVSRWRPEVKKALNALHLSTSDGMIAKVLRQISTESSGNPNAMGGTDGLNDGRAMGLMQVKPGTFKAYGLPSLGGWNNGYASIYAGLNYAMHRYGKDLSFLGQGHGYANGGWSNMPAVFGEVPGQPEVAINPHRDSADGLIKQAIDARLRINPNSPIGAYNKHQKSKNQIQKLRSTFSSLLSSAKSKAKTSINLTFNNTFNISGSATKEDGIKISRIQEAQIKNIVEKVLGMHVESTMNNLFK